MNGSEEVTTGARSTKTIKANSADVSAYEMACRAMFSAASRVLSYHAAALDAKVARINDAQAEPNAFALANNAGLRHN